MKPSTTSKDSKNRKLSLATESVKNLKVKVGIKAGRPDPSNDWNCPDW